MKMVVTYQSPRGSRVSICDKCITKFKKEDTWPKDWSDREYCTVHHDRHHGTCDFCAYAKGSRRV